jgi:hypothetical protein
MNTSIFLAKVIGLYFVIVGLFTVIRYEYIEKTLKELNREPGMILIIAIITVILGLLLVISHNIWVMDWRIIITLVAWFTLLIGLFRLFFLDSVVKLGEWWIKHKGFLFSITALFFLIGLYLTYKGFK